MGCECQKIDDQNQELTAEETGVIKNLVPNNDYLLRKQNDNNNNNIKNNINNINNNNNISQKSVKQNAKPLDEFSKYIFKQINSLRQNPQAFIDVIQKAKEKVTLDKSGIKIYKSSVKVALNSGEPAFDEAINILRNTEPMNKLIFNPNFVIDIPRNELDVKSREYLSEQIKKKVDEGVDVKSFWKDIVREPESCFILTVVDDSGKNAGSKRNDILNKDNKYIGISSVKIGKSFACYIVIG